MNLKVQGWLAQGGHIRNWKLDGSIFGPTGVGAGCGMCCHMHRYAGMLMTTPLEQHLPTL